MDVQTLVGKKKIENEWDGIFVCPVASDAAILMVDASGSVRSPFSSTSPTVLDECRRLAKELPHRHFKVLYWNSPNMNDGFKSGVLKFPYVMTKDKFDVNFAFVSSKINNHCLTYPNLGFSGIGDWLSEKFSQTVYLLTDGQMGYSAHSRP